MATTTMKSLLAAAATSIAPVPAKAAVLNQVLGSGMNNFAWGVPDADTFNCTRPSILKVTAISISGAGFLSVTDPDASECGIDGHLASDFNFATGNGDTMVGTATSSAPFS